MRKQYFGSFTSSQQFKLDMSSDLQNMERRVKEPLRGYLKVNWFFRKNSHE